MSLNWPGKEEPSRTEDNTRSALQWPHAASAQESSSRPPPRQPEPPRWSDDHRASSPRPPPGQQEPPRWPKHQPQEAWQDWESRQPPPFEEEPPSSQRLYKDKDNGWITGVCAGLAEYFKLNISIVRLLAVIGFFSFPLVGFIYLVMALALPTKPMPARRKGVNLRAHLDQLQQQLSNVERKVGQLESYITSDEFDFQRRVGALKRDQ